LTLVMLMNEIINIFYIVAKLMATGSIGTATNFSASNDPWNPNPLLYCTNRIMTDTELIVAHPVLPCGSKVFLYAPRTQRAVVAQVSDRGPRRALVDLAPATTKALKANGRELVYLIPISTNDARLEGLKSFYKTR